MARTPTPDKSGAADDNSYHGETSIPYELKAHRATALKGHPYKGPGFDYVGRRIKLLKPIVEASALGEPVALNNPSPPGPFKRVFQRVLGR